jgi:hypothetical protein
MTEKEQLLKDIEDHNDSVGLKLSLKAQFSIQEYEHGIIHHRDLLEELKAITRAAEIDLISI